MPTTDKATGIVGLTFFVDPGNRVYVRNITFSGVKRINDEVLRREMRILEGGGCPTWRLIAPSSASQRLPFIKRAEIKGNAGAGIRGPRGPGRTKVEERPASEIGGGIGYGAGPGLHVEWKLH